MRLVVLGGSGASTPELLEAIAEWPNAASRRPELDIVLVGRSADKLGIVADACRAVAPTDGPRVRITTSTDSETSVLGADVVLHQVRIGGYSGRAFDESFPWSANLPGEETMGPGGFANALRTIPELADTWRILKAVGPAVLVINLTNPAGLVQSSARNAGLANVVSVCDAPMPMLRDVAERLGRDVDAVIARYAGMNHLGWYFPEDDSELALLRGLAKGLDDAAVQVHGAIGAAYVRYYVHPDRILRDQRGRETRAHELQRRERDLLGAYASGLPVPHRRAVWYRLSVVPLLDAWVNGSPQTLLVGVPNGQTFPDIPADVTLELPHVASGPGRLEPVRPVQPAGVPRALLQRQGMYEHMVLEALHGGRDRIGAIRALMANPLVTSYDQAAALFGSIEGSEWKWESRMVDAREAIAR